MNGFTITEHDLAGVPPALWDLSEAMQISSNIYFAHVGLELGQRPYLAGAEQFGFCDGLRVGAAPHDLAVSASAVTAVAEAGCEDFVDDAELASAAFGQARVTATPMQMALVAATIANGGTMVEPFVVREVRTPPPAAGEQGAVTASYDSPGRRQVVSRVTADQVRAVMVDAVHGPLGAPYAGAGNVANYGIGGVQTAGKTGTAERGEGLPPHSWFIGFVAGPAGSRTVHRGGGHRRGRRSRVDDRGPDRWTADGRVAAAGRKLNRRPLSGVLPHEPLGRGLGYCPVTQGLHQECP